jgi:hypothetical protein
VTGSAAMTEMRLFVTGSTKLVYALGYIAVYHAGSTEESSGLNIVEQHPNQSDYVFIRS